MLKSILKRIIKKGGVYGAAASLYIHDKEKVSLLIKECYENSHTPLAKKLWGKALIADLTKYHNALSAKNRAKSVKNE